ncbi:uncharacterized protein MONOS_14206 [Monocercomonoides exilis]|uniref:uncharacterized protein n=1 Tax=Monocercomonoides exilis TaxID=2049356 RepID=UPI003559E329|nr:hypothetical protein MONOS_14206 [Monocercomonoides exilis]|eukprot:MONOS_14206.1-p1 / transcript=MONOS_14206.1 / gene=MONOS_14206 / organism=Monocercomonoides_exilis_PA203 / gene_product=unspecified product / transcript_product=unspecified product / location=Mono_scaffold00956:590-3389(+) / protein_length=586 / sequence_SO=supercontig / SO=protein_coding / is_pseudo=false
MTFKLKPSKIKHSLIDDYGSIGVLTNITLKGWGRGGEIYSGRLFGGKGYGGEKGGSEEKGGEGGEMGRDRGREGDGYGEGIEGSISVSESHFSSFCVSSAPFLSSPSIPLISLSQLTFFNISTANDACSPPTTTSTQTSSMMNSCSFSSVCDIYDGGIVPSLNNPFASLIASNTSFVGCCRTRNVDCIGEKNDKLAPGRQNTTENGANTFVWCEWSGSRTTGESDSYTDGISSGGAICIRGGGIMCNTIKSVHIENDVFNECTAQNHYGGGLYVVTISTCVRISGCEFQNCKAYSTGGGLYLENFNATGAGCIGNENEGGESACVFDCSFTSCSITNTWGGGMLCKNVPATQFKMRSIQFISCSAASHGGGLCFAPWRDVLPSDKLYCFFLFFHNCSCSSDSDPSYGADLYYEDYYSLYLNSDCPFKECYTTNTDEKRMCYAYNASNSESWTYQHTEKKEWLKGWTKVLFVGVNGKDSSGLCGMGESAPCQTVGHAVETGLEELSSSVTLLDGNHQSETTTIDIGSKKISVIGKGRETCLIGAGALSSSSGELFIVSTGHLGMSHLKVDCNSIAETSPNSRNMPS